MQKERKRWSTEEDQKLLNIVNINPFTINAGLLSASKQLKLSYNQVTSRYYVLKNKIEREKIRNKLTSLEKTQEKKVNPIIKQEVIEQTENNKDSILYNIAKQSIQSLSKEQRKKLLFEFIL